MKVALIRFNNKVKPASPKYRPPMKVEGVTEIGEGPHFIHIFMDGRNLLTETNFRYDLVDDITLFEQEEEAETPAILDAAGEPFTPESDDFAEEGFGDEAQLEEQPPVQRKDAGATPVVPAISDAGVV